MGVVSVSCFGCPWPAAPAVTESIPKQNFAYGGRNFGHADVLWRGVGAPRGKVLSFTMGWRNRNKIRLVSLPWLLLQQWLPKFSLFRKAVDSSHGRDFCNFVLCNDCPIYFLTAHTTACCRMKIMEFDAHMLLVAWLWLLRRMFSVISNMLCAPSRVRRGARTQILRFFYQNFINQNS